MDFIFMLTQDDRTVANCLDVITTIAPLKLRHIGFKDIGADVATLRALNQHIKAAGAVSYLEVVATSPQAALNSARMAVEIGVDKLLGGTQVEATLAILKNTLIQYYPFPGTPIGHPTKLAGTAANIAADTTNFMNLGCHGIDLLAYRATDANPLDLIAAARTALDNHPAHTTTNPKSLICAGNIDSAERIATLHTAGVDAFTIGSAAFDSTFSPAPTLTGQLEAIMGCL